MSIVGFQVKFAANCQERRGSLFAFKPPSVLKSALVLKPIINLTAPILRTLIVGLVSGLIAFACLRFLLPAPSATLLSRHAETSTVSMFLDAHGANKPLLAAYFELLKNYAHADFGYSWVNQLPVGPLIANALCLRLFLTLPGTLLAHALALFCALKSRYNAFWPALFSQFSTATGVLICALLAQWLLCRIWFNGSGFAGSAAYFAPFGLILDSAAAYFRSVTAPTLGLVLALFGAQFSYYRALLQTPERNRTILAARSLGLRGWRLLLASVRPSLSGLLSRLGSSVPMQVIGGSVVVELVFAVPGIGRTGINAALAADAPLLVAIAITSALALSACMALADALARLSDPRLGNPRSSLS